MLDWVLTGLKYPERLYSVQEIRQRGAIPPRAGVYGWYFRALPPGIKAGCHANMGMDLLYIGIAPKSAQSKSTLRRRLADHARDDASRSTLRRSLGSLLGYRKDQARARFWFGAKEAELSQWLRDNAMVCWVECPTPWEIEKAVICELHPPLNLDHNGDGPYFRTLSDLRKKSRLERSDSL